MNKGKGGNLAHIHFPCKVMTCLKKCLSRIRARAILHIDKHLMLSLLQVGLVVRSLSANKCWNRYFPEKSAIFFPRIEENVGINSVPCNKRLDDWNTSIFQYGRPNAENDIYSRKYAFESRFSHKPFETGYAWKYNLYKSFFSCCKEKCSKVCPYLYVNQLWCFYPENNDHFAKGPD